MPPRLPFPSILALRPAKPSASCSLPLIPVAHAHSKTNKRRLHDPYLIAQIKARKEANIRRQEELRAERTAALGDPIRGTTTPFLESFDNPAKADLKLATDLTSLEPTSQIKLAANLNHFLKPSEVEKSLQHSFILTQPVLATTRDEIDPVVEREQIKKHGEIHERAVAAIQRIVNLENGNSKDRLRANKQRIIETFGRHNTDTTLKPSPPSNVPRGPNACPAPIATPRAGPDTGSSEVQIAILTAKIRTLADQLDKKRGNKDKVNKRNLRVMVHKRQKLLTYLRRKEHGGPRWQNLIETLGLTEGTWKGEISL